MHGTCCIATSRNQCNRIFYSYDGINLGLQLNLSSFWIANSWLSCVAYGDNDTYITMGGNRQFSWAHGITANGGD